ncbi:MAG: XRE family transcriptional regulator [Gemmatimonadota bacterium]
MAVHRWEDIRARRSPEMVERAKQKADALSTALQLRELRELRGLTQEQLAERLGAHQSGISRLEKRENIHVDTLREVIEAMGGELEITARFPDGESVHVRI